MDMDPGAVLLLISVLMLPVAGVSTLAEMLALHVILARKGRMAIGHLIGLVILAALAMTILSWWPHAAMFLLVFGAISAALAILVDLPILAAFDRGRTRPYLPTSFRPWASIGGPTLLGAIGLILPPTLHAASAGTADERIPWSAFVIAYLILLVPIAIVVGLTRWAEFAFAKKRARPVEPAIDPLTATG